MIEGMILKLQRPTRSIGVYQSPHLVIKRFFDDPASINFHKICPIVSNSLPNKSEDKPLPIL